MPTPSHSHNKATCRAQATFLTSAIIFSPKRCLSSLLQRHLVASRPAGHLASFVRAVFVRPHRFYSRIFDPVPHHLYETITRSTHCRTKTTSVQQRQQTSAKKMNRCLKETFEEMLVYECSQNVRKQLSASNYAPKASVVKCTRSLCEAKGSLIPAQRDRVFPLFLWVEICQSLMLHQSRDSTPWTSTSNPARTTALCPTSNNDMSIDHAERE